MRAVLPLLALLLLASAAIAVPSQVFQVADGVVEIRDDMGVWGGLSNGITHMNKGDYTARKILDTSAVPAADWNAAPEIRLSVFFMVRDYSKNELGKANGLDEKYQIVVNDKVYEYETGGGAPVYAEPGLPTGQWYDFIMPKAVFVHGANEILMRKSPDSKGDDYLYLGIDNSQKRGNSAVAFDGINWTQDKLTIPGGNGEYMIRLYLLSKPTLFEAKWQPGKATSDYQQPFIAYAGGRNLKAAANGLTIPAGQSARVEWAAETLDKLEPVTATVQAEGALKFEWLDAQGAVAKGQAPAKDGKLALPGRRAFQPSGVLITATEAPVVLTSVTIAGSRSYHPLPVKVNIAPAIKAVSVPPAMKPSCKITNGEISLSGGQLRATFKRGSNLRLTSLHNNVTKTEMVRDPSASALFLVEVGEKRYAGNRDFRLTSVKPTENGFVAQMDLADPALRGVLTVRMEPGGLHMGFNLTNSGQKATDFKLAFPHLAGLVVSPEIKDDYYFYPWGGGIISDTSATIRRGYGDHEALYQVMDLYSPALGGGLYMRADDAEGWHKVVAMRKHIPGSFDVNQEIMSMRVKPEYQWKPGPLDVIDGTSMAYEYLRRTRQPGESFAPASAVLTAHAGDWHTAMSDYSKWAHQVWKFRPYPSALKSVRNMMAAGWGWQGALFKDGKYRTDFIRPDTDCIELMSWWDWSPLGPFMTPFDQLDKVLTPAQIKMWETYFVTDPVTGKKMWNNQPGDYKGYNERFGGLPAFQQAVKTYQSMGSLTTLYTDPFRMDENCDIGRAHGKEWCVIDDKDKLSTGYEVFNPCHDLPAVREWVAETMGRVMRETGADGIRLDEYGHRGWACYSPAHKHTYAEPGITQWQKATTEATRMVHEEMDKVRPGLVLTTEHPGYDYMMKDLEGCITYDLTVMKSPLRPLEVNTQRFYFPECKAYELDHQGADLLSHKKFWNAVESFGRYYPSDMYTILNENEDVYQGRDNLALAPTLQPYLYANRFSGAGKTMYHLYNAMGHTFEGPVLNLSAVGIAGPGADRFHAFELLTCRELPIEKDQVSVYLERNDVACVAFLPKVIQTNRQQNQLQVTLKNDIDGRLQVFGAKGMRLIVSDVSGKELLTQDARPGAVTLDLSGLEKPACVKLLRDGQLVDAAQLPL